MDNKKKKTDAAIKATQKYDKKAYFSKLVLFKKDEEQTIRQAAEDAGMSLNSFIASAVREKLKKSQ